MRRCSSWVADSVSRLLRPPARARWRSRRHRQRGGLELREVEDVVDQHAAAARAFAWAMVSSLRLLLGVLEVALVGQQLDRALDRGQRRADLVRDDRDELRLEPVEALGVLEQLRVAHGDRRSARRTARGSSSSSALKPPGLSSTASTPITWSSATMRHGEHVRPARRRPRAASPARRRTAHRWHRAAARDHGRPSSGVSREHIAAALVGAPGCSTPCTERRGRPRRPARATGTRSPRRAPQPRPRARDHGQARAEREVGADFLAHLVERWSSAASRARTRSAQLVLVAAQNFVLLPQLLDQPAVESLESAVGEAALDDLQHLVRDRTAW